MILGMVESYKKVMETKLDNLRYEWEKNNKIAGRGDEKAPF